MTGTTFTFLVGHEVLPIWSSKEWAHVAAVHDMKCGKCRPGTLRVAAMSAIEYQPASVLILLRCDNEWCDMEIEMPPYAKEETRQQEEV